MDNIDFSILEYIYEHGNIHLTDILNRFPEEKFSTKYRLEILSERKKHSSGYFYLENSSYIEIQYSCRETDLGNVYDSTDIYFITEKGKVALQEHKISIKNEKIYTFKHSFLYPILSAVIAACITAYITTKVLIK